MPDKTIVCGDCQQPFVFSDGEQKFFKTQKFADPKRCPKCRKARKTGMNAAPVSEKSDQENAE